MSDRTPTNEETLAGLVSGLKEGETLVLLSDASQGDNTGLVRCYITPKGYETNQLYSLHRAGKGPDDPELKPYWKGSFMAVEFHREVWDPKPNRAAVYR